ncbi:hypothetical protein [Candidatus Avelusimicrobium stercoris]|uniref:hypothetical protein n=1 Tax=Candidatus Avelusimicrobium stercoris TaxID=1947924 RepID=UPI003D102D8C
MKIPQRQDQVSLNAPQTSAGRVPEPTMEGLGSSYIKTMKGLSKSLQDISDLQFKLSMNATQGQLDRFNLYATQRTKQYEKELSLATTQEQINDLFANYKKDIDENGVNSLGTDLYNGWYSREGGEKIATAEYSGSLASAQLQIALNKQTLNDAGRQYNELAFTAGTPEEREQYVKEWEDMLGRYVANGTISEAEKQKAQQEWNLNFTRALVTQDMDLHPEKTAKALREDKNYAPILTSDDRLRYAIQAEDIANRRRNTQADSNVKLLKEVWLAYYKSGEEQGRNIALNAYKDSVESNKDAKTIFGAMFKNLGVSGLDGISNLELEEFARWADTTVRNADQETVDQFWDNREKFDIGYNELTAYDGGKKHADLTTLGKFKYGDKNPSDVVNAYKQNLAQKNNIQMASIINNSAETRKKVNAQQETLLGIYVNGLDKKFKGTEQWEQNMYNFLKPYYKAIKDDSTGDSDIQMRRFVQYLWEHYDPKELFADTSKIPMSAIGNAIAMTTLPTDESVYKVFRENFLKKPSTAQANSADRKDITAGGQGGVLVW